MRQAVAGEPGDPHPAQRGAARRPDHAVAGIKRHSSDPAARRHSGVDTRVDNPGDRDPGPGKGGGERIGIVIIGEQHRPPSRHHRVAMEIAQRGARQHDAGAIVVGEHNRTLQGPGRQHHPTGADMPETLARQEGRRRRTKLLSDPFDRDQVIIVVMAGYRRRGQQPHLRQRRQFGDRRFCPRHAVAIADAVGAAQQRATEYRVAVGEDHPGAPASGGERGGEAGGSAADHQDVAMGVAFVVARRVGQ